MKKLIFISALFLSLTTIGQNIKTIQKEEITYCSFDYMKIGKIQTMSFGRASASKSYSSELEEITYSINFLINYPLRISIDGGEHVLIKTTDNTTLDLINRNHDYGSYSSDFYWTGYLCNIDEDDLIKIADTGISKIRFGSVARNIDIEVKKKDSDKFCKLLNELISMDIKDATPDVLKDF